jgi:hypothetical protein
MPNATEGCQRLQTAATFSAGAAGSRSQVRCDKEVDRKLPRYGSQNLRTDRIVHSHCVTDLAVIIYYIHIIIIIYIIYNNHGSTALYGLSEVTWSCAFLAVSDQLTGRAVRLNPD